MRSPRSDADDAADDDAPVLVIDLRRAVMDDVAREVDAASAGAFVPRLLPAPPERCIEHVALLVDGDAGAEAPPVLLPIAPTRDVRWLDALARLVRFAVLRGERIDAIAQRYGSDYERSLLDRGALPRWAIDGIEGEELPDDVARALGPRAR